VTENRHQLTGAWALDAVDDAERADIEEYLESDPEAAAEARSFTETAAALALSLDPIAPPPGLKDDVLSRIARTRQLPPEGAADAPQAPAARTVPDDAGTPAGRDDTGRGPATGDSVRGDGTPGDSYRSDGGRHRARPMPESTPRREDRPAQVVPLDRYRASVRRSRWLAVAAVGLLATSIGGAALWTAERSQQRDAEMRIEALESAQAETARQQAVVSTILAADDTSSTSVPVDGGGALDLLYSVEDGAMVVTTSGLPALPEGKEYQMWLIEDPQHPESVATMSDDDSTLVLTRGMEGVTTLAVSVEPAGGSVSPTPDAIVAQGQL